MSELRATKKDGTVVDAAVVRRSGRDILVEAIEAKQHGQRRKMRGYDNPTSHMHGWPVERRMDAWAYPLIEIICKHGTGHPMPESVEFLSAFDKANGKTDRRWGSHGCDGCCMRPNPINPEDN